MGIDLPTRTWTNAYAYLFIALECIYSVHVKWPPVRLHSCSQHRWWQGMWRCSYEQR